MNTTILYSLGNTLKIPISDSDGRSGSATLEINSDPHEAAVISQTVSVLNGEGVFELSEDEKKKLKIGNYVYRIIFTDTDSITTEWSGIFAVIYGAANEKNGVLIPSKLNIEVVNSPNSAISPGIYAIEDETVVFNTKYRQILIVSEYIEPAMGEETILQALFDAEHGSIKLRKRVDYSWSDWETVGETDLSEYIKNTDYATNSNFGVVKIGTGIKSVDGVIQTDIANETLIMGRNSSASVNEVITPSNLNFAVKSALSDDRRISDMTDEEKANARGVIGALGASVLNDYYTKSQVDTKTSGTCKYKGKTNILPNAASVGDVWVKTVGDYGKFCGVNVVSVHAYGMGLESEGGDMVLSSASGFAVGKTYYVSTNGKNILGTITPTGISGNTLSFTYQTHSDYYGVFCDIAETKDADYWNTWMSGEPVSIGEVYYFYNADFDTTPPSEDSLNVTIHEPNTPFAWTGTAWDALGGTVDFSDYYTRTQVDGKIAAAIETALNTEV